MTKRKNPVTLCPPWKPMSSAPLDGTCVLLLERTRYAGFLVHTGKYEFRKFQNKSGCFWVANGTIYTSGPRFCGWAPIPKLPSLNPLFQVGARVRIDKVLHCDPDPEWGIIDMVFPEPNRRVGEGVRWLYSITTDAGENRYVAESQLSDEEDIKSAGG